MKPRKEFIVIVLLIALFLTTRVMAGEPIDDDTIATPTVTFPTPTPLWYPGEVYVTMTPPAPYPAPLPYPEPNPGNTTAVALVDFSAHPHDIMAEISNIINAFFGALFNA